jgi:hypothetical protein
MCSVRAASDHERDMFGRTSLPLLGALPLAVRAFAGCGGNASHALPTTNTTTNNGRPASVNAFGGSWFAVSPAGAKVAPHSQPQGGGGYGGGY